MTLPWQDIGYLLNGTPRQQAAYHVLQGLQIFEILQDFTPVLAGTIPLGIEIPSSDLDILCEAHDADAFEYRVTTAFSGRTGFQIKSEMVDGLPTTIVNFEADRFPIEIFAQPPPVIQQNAYRHMVVEARLLAIGGPNAANEIRKLKQKGLKTEPAFAEYFRLSGDAYATLLALADL